MSCGHSIVLLAHVVSSSTGGLVCGGSCRGARRGESCNSLAVLVMTVSVSRCCEGGAALQSKASSMAIGA